MVEWQKAAPWDFDPRIGRRLNSGRNPQHLDDYFYLRERLSKEARFNEPVGLYWSGYWRGGKGVGW